MPDLRCIKPGACPPFDRTCRGTRVSRNSRSANETLVESPCDGKPTPASTRAAGRAGR
jgi:hypothetical protein